MSEEKRCVDCNRVVGYSQGECSRMMQNHQYDACRSAQLSWTQAQLSAATARASELEIRAHESRALLQRMAKYVREDRATTAGSTRLERLTVQVTDYLQRTHDPRSILRGEGLLQPETKGTTDE